VFPLHHSHALSSEVSVERVVHDGIQGHPKTRLSAGARGELVKLSPLLDTMRLTEEADRRTSLLTEAENVLRAGPVYRKLIHVSGAPPCEFADFVWKNQAPPKI
jgi:hypothetical protein